MGSASFRPRLSHWIIGLYWAIIIFFASVVVAAAIFSDTGSLAFTILTVTFSAVSLILVFILSRAYRMKFTITASHIIVDGVFRKNVIKRSEIRKIEKTPIPFGFRLFGASFLGGYYFFPGIGKAWVSMGNFEDGVMITTKEDKRFVITPQKPLDFIKRAKRP